MAIRDSYEQGRPCWVDLSTSDPEAARGFYGELFGWEADVDPRPEAGGYAQFKKEGHAVAGVGPLQGEGHPPYWATYIATDDVEATVEAVKANGGKVFQPPMDILDAGRMAIFASPDGAVTGLWEAKAHKGAALVNQPGGWAWSQLMTRDKPAALDFYKKVFDWHLKEDPSWGEYISLGAEGGEIAGATQAGDELPAQVPPHWQVSFMVDDADQVAARVKELGGNTAGPVEDAPMSGRRASLLDPQGAAFTVMSFPAEPSQ